MENKENIANELGLEGKGLACIGKLSDSYWVFDPTSGIPNQTNEQLWLVLKNIDGIGHRLQVKDIIKFGRSGFIIKELTNDAIENDNAKIEIFKEESPQTPKSIKVEIVKEGSIFPEAQPDCNQIEKELGGTLGEDRLSRALTIGFLEEVKNSPTSLKKLSKQENEEENQCRVCLRRDFTPNNQLISSPCKCTGSIQYIHINCLQAWLKSKIIESKYLCCICYTWKQFECDVCKMKYPGICFS